MIILNNIYKQIIYIFIIEQIFIWIKKNYFRPIFGALPNLWRKKTSEICKKKIWFCQAQPHKLCSTMSKHLRHLMIQFQDKILCTWTEGRIEQTDPTSWDLLATAGSPTWTTAEDWNLKAKDTVYDVVLTKNYCIYVSMQKINSIHKLIFEI